jgi:hypothetical protein
MNYCIIGTGPTNNLHADTCQLITRNLITHDVQTRREQSQLRYDRDLGRRRNRLQNTVSMQKTFDLYHALF